MSRNILVYVIAALALLGVGAGGGILVYNAVVGGDGEASEAPAPPTLDINAVPTLSNDDAFALATENAELAARLDDAQATLEAQSAQVAAMSTEMANQPAIDSAPEATEAAMPEAEMTEAPVADAGGEVADGETTRALFRIVLEESEARFNIDEDLRGNRITVVGVTDQVGGDMIVDFADPAQSQVGTIRINVRTLATDNTFRNQALRARILESSRDEFEFSDFVPTALEGMPQGPVNVGDTLEFTIIGDLTVRDVTRPVNFAATVTVDSETRISGSATTTILYRDFSITIPNAPGVANISNEVILEIDFVAALVEEA